jgi:hypothetical protein
MKVIPENITIYLMKVFPEKHYNIPDEGYPRKILQYT